MKNNNVIDISHYFVQTRQPETEKQPASTCGQVLHNIGRVLDIASTAAIAVCLFTCVLLFFTML